jgi:hypothetical protein
LNVGIHHPLRNAKLPVAACLALSGALAGPVLAAGCSAAPAGAAGGSPPVGPVRTGAAAANFPPFPVPAKWAGAGGVRYTMIVKAKTGSAPRTFSLIPKSGLELWLGCIGAGTARVVSAPLGLNWAVPCGASADPAGLGYTPPGAALDKKAKVLVTSPPGTRWVFRADERSAPRKTAKPVSSGAAASSPAPDPLR